MDATNGGKGSTGGGAAAAAPSGGGMAGRADDDGASPPPFQRPPAAAAASSGGARPGPCASPPLRPPPPLQPPPAAAAAALGPVHAGEQLLRLECMTATHTRQLLGALAVARNAALLTTLALFVLRLRPLGARGGAARGVGPCARAVAAHACTRAHLQHGACAPTSTPRRPRQTL